MPLSTALGMTKTLDLGTPDLSTVFSLPVCETQMQWSVLVSEYLRKVLVTMALASANPNNEWSVKMVPYMRAQRHCRCTVCALSWCFYL